MQARINNPAMIVPDALQSLLAFSKSADHAGISPRTMEMIHLRASQINGCSVCVNMHSEGLQKLGESNERIFAVAAWREAEFFTDAERAALALTEAATRLSDRTDPVPDEVWNEAARHYDEKALASMVITIAAINAWNRLNVTTKQPAGASSHK